MKVLFLCTSNSARSQMAEAVFNREAKGEHTAFSAGSAPAKSINRYAADVLKRHGHDVNAMKPKHLREFLNKDIDIVITLCDSMKEECPDFGPDTIHAHFGTADPESFQGTDTEIQKQVNKVFAEISNRIDLFLFVLKKGQSKEKMREAIKKVGTAEQ